MRGAEYFGAFGFYSTLIPTQKTLEKPMINPDPLKEVASCINRLGPDKNRWINVRMQDGHCFRVAQVSVVGSLLLGVTNPDRPRDEYVLINPSAVAMYLPGDEVAIASAA